MCDPFRVGSFHGHNPGRRSFHSLTLGFNGRLFQRQNRLRDSRLPAYFRQQAVVLFGSNELPGIGSNAVKVTGCVHRLPTVAE